MAHNTAPPQETLPPSSPPGGGASRPVQGEGDYEAAQRYREEVKEFLEHSDVDERARAAAPQSAKQERELALAEERGKDRSKGDDPMDVGLMYPGRTADDAQASEEPQSDRLERDGNSK